MQSKNKKSMSVAERRHVEAVKSQPCSQCEAFGPSEAHEIKQGQWFTSIAWCADCHRGPQGWHGDKTLSRIYKMDELDCLNVTLQRILEN